MPTVNQPSYRKRIGYHATLLWGIAAICSAGLAIGYKTTLDEIQLRKNEDMQASLQQVIPASLYDNDLLLNTVEIQDEEKNITVYRGSKEDKLTAFAFQITGNGYAGPIDIMLGINTEGEILGTRVISHSETPGLGDKIEVQRSNWIESFTGLSFNNLPEDKWKVKKDGGHFDQFTGATITPRAVVKTVKQGLDIYRRHKQEFMLQLKTDAMQKKK